MSGLCSQRQWQSTCILLAFVGIVILPMMDEVSSFSLSSISPTSSNTMMGIRYDRRCATCLLLAKDDETAFETVGSRRSFLLQNAVALGAVALSSRPSMAGASASDVRAPLDLLLPATRVKLYIDQAVAMCQSMKSSEEGSSSLATRLVTLRDLLENEPPFMTEKEEKLSKRYLEIKTGAAWQDARRKEREARGAELGIDYTTPYDQINTAIQQWGDNRQFQILRSRQQTLEKSSTIRTALNAYTNNLVFGDAYQLNVQGEQKKALVRNDALPNVNAVVVSDLDLRDLYRNQVLQNMDDARAEIQYQLQSSDFNMEDILTYLSQAQSSCQDWFNFIPKADVEEALKLVLDERRL